jgi:hypothetical protein
MISSIVRRWKRRFGITLIVIGSVFLGEWARSGHYEDDIRFRIGRQSVFAVHTYRRCMGFFWIQDSTRPIERKWNGERLNNEFLPIFRNALCEWSSSDIQGQIPPNREGGPIEHVRWSWEFVEFRTGSESEISDGAWVILVPYWVITPLLFFLAACLFLFKPKPFGATSEPRVEYE